MNSVIRKKRKTRNLTMVTVVTVVLNGAEHIESTILSVIGQDYPDIEYLVVDGGSTDGTLDIIKRHKARIAGIISEPDNGLYDAMNKAAAVAKGEWILFMNAGDTFYSDSVLSGIFNYDVRNYDLIYGDTVFRYASGLQTLIRARALDTIWKCMPVFHQAMIVRTDIMKRHPFSPGNLSADHEFLWKCLIEGYRMHNTGMVISVYLDGGVSARKSIEVLKSRWRNAMKLSPSPWIYLYYVYCYLKQSFRNFVRRALPVPVLDTVIRIKNRRILHTHTAGIDTTHGDVK